MDLEQEHDAQEVSKRNLIMSMDLDAFRVRENRRKGSLSVVMSWFGVSNSFMFLILGGFRAMLNVFC